MHPRLSLLFATTAMILSAAAPVLAGVRAGGPLAPCGDRTCTMAIAGAGPGAPLIRVDDDEDDEGGWAALWGEDDDDDDDCDDDDDEDDDEDEGGCRGLGRNPAPAGTVAPPANGLFGTGKPPVAVTN